MATWLDSNGIRILVEPWDLPIEPPPIVLAWMRDKLYTLAGGRYLSEFGTKVVPRSRPWETTTFFELYGDQYPCSCYEGPPELQPPCEPQDGLERILTPIEGFPLAVTTFVEGGCVQHPHALDEGDHGYLEEYGLITVAYARWVSVTEEGEPYEDWIRCEPGPLQEVDLSPYCVTPEWLSGAWIDWWEDAPTSNLLNDLMSTYGLTFRLLHEEVDFDSEGSWSDSSEPVETYTKRLMVLQDADLSVKYLLTQWELPEGEWEEDAHDAVVEFCGLEGGAVCCPPTEGPPGPQGEVGPEGPPGEPGADSSLGEFTAAVLELRDALVGVEGLEKPLAEEMVTLVQSIEAAAHVEVVGEFEKDGMVLTTRASRESA